MGEDREKALPESEEREKVLSDDDVEGHKLLPEDRERALPPDEDVEAHKLVEP